MGLFSGKKSKPEVDPTTRTTSKQCGTFLPKGKGICKAPRVPGMGTCKGQFCQEKAMGLI
jgi:hypothetical protein